MRRTRNQIFSTKFTSGTEEQRIGPVLLFPGHTDKGLDERISRLGRAILEDKIADRDFCTLVGLGCRPELLGLFLLQYTDDREIRHVREEALEAARRAAQFCRDFQRLQNSFAELHQNPYGSWQISQAESQFDASPLVNPRLAAFCKGLKESFIPLMKEVGSSRGEVRKERGLVGIVDHLRNQTGQPHFVELANLVHVAQSALGGKGSANVNADLLEKKYERYKSKSTNRFRMSSFY